MLKIFDGLLDIHKIKFFIILTDKRVFQILFIPKGSSVCVFISISISISISIYLYVCVCVCVCVCVYLCTHVFVEKSSE